MIHFNFVIEDIDAENIFLCIQNNTYLKELKTKMKNTYIKKPPSILL